MSRYTLEVVEPPPKPYIHIDKDQLESALEAIATVHGGMVVESHQPTANGRQRRFVNIFDCEKSLPAEVEWLRQKFPDVRFTLKQFTYT